MTRDVYLTATVTEPLTDQEPWTTASGKDIAPSLFTTRWKQEAGQWKLDRANVFGYYLGDDGAKTSTSGWDSWRLRPGSKETPKVEVMPDRWADLARDHWRGLPA